MKFLPPWVADYSRANLYSDVLAGVVVAILVIPQSLAYALLAGLPPQVGLVVSIFPVIAYALLGSSLTQAVGPVAITSIMTYAVLSPLATPGSAQYVALAAGLSLCSGVVILGCGVLRLGFLSQLLSRPVVSGFISGSAVLIVISQIKYLLGLSVNAADTWSMVATLGSALHNAKAPTVALAGVALAWLAFSRLGLAAVYESTSLSAAQKAVMASWFGLMAIGPRKLQEELTKVRFLPAYRAPILGKTLQWLGALRAEQ